MLVEGCVWSTSNLVDIDGLSTELGFPLGVVGPDGNVPGIETEGPLPPDAAPPTSGTTLPSR